MQNLGDAISVFLKKHRLTERIEAEPVFEAFREALTNDKKDYATPVRFARGVLEISVASAALQHELQHFQNEQILAAIRRRIPGVKINKIRYRPANGGSERHNNTNHHN
ncbi:MAG: DUF721 domain-containing protein [Planctomycetota bacterium]